MSLWSVVAMVSVCLKRAKRLCVLASCLVLAPFFLTGNPAAAETNPSVYESREVPVADSKIDKLVFARLKQLHIQPVLCSDAVFVRRAYLDVLGTLPTAEEARDFLNDPNISSKRRRLIDKLLARPEFADYWAMKWGDILRIKAEFPVNLWPVAAQAYSQWVRSCLAENKPYDKFAREMLTASGSNFRQGPVNFYRAVQSKNPQGIAAAVTLTFMGCHLDSLPAKNAAGLSAFFSQVGYKPTREWKEEVVFWDPFKAQEKAASFPDGTRVKLTGARDPRDIFADWLVAPSNPWFRRAMVNRIWYWLLGRGIIQEPDDIRPSNPPSHPALLAYLESELVASHYDLKHIYRLILQSQTYQLSSMPRFNTKEAAANFASYPLRRLDAEVLIDAINKVTGSSEHYSSAIPEPFTYLPENMPAVAIGDGSITSPFLSLFGRSARSTGMLAERSNKVESAQFLHMLNSSHILTKLQRSSQLRSLVSSNSGRPQAIIEQLYLTILSRYPTPRELENAMAYGGSATAGKRPRDWLDIAWALVNTTEFLYRH